MYKHDVMFAHKFLVKLKEGLSLEEPHSLRCEFEVQIKAFRDCLVFLVANVDRSVPVDVDFTMEAFVMVSVVLVLVWCGVCGCGVCWCCVVHWEAREREGGESEGGELGFVALSDVCM